MHYRIVVFVGIALVAGLAVTTAQEERDVWQDLRPLVGRWGGEGSGFGTVSDVTHEWKFVFHGKFLKLETKSVARAEEGTGEIHEDVGLISYDTNRSSFVFRQFLSEGFVNIFDVVVEPGDEGTILFESRESESAGATRARMRLTFHSATEYEMVLDLAAPGKEFVACQRMVMKKVG